MVSNKIVLKNQKSMNLSKTEFNVAAYLSSGLETKIIAHKMNRSNHTVIAHLRNIRKKNGCKNIADITREFTLKYGDPRLKTID